MDSGGKASSLLFLMSSLSLLIRFKSLTPHYSSSHSTSSRLYRMATRTSSSSSSSCSVPAGDGINPPGSGVTAPSSAIDFLSLCHRLKTTKRTGWIRREIKDPESIADHMYRMGLMALIAPDIPGVDRDKCIKMAIVHDIAEAIVGDITPSDGISKAEKSRREREALDHMCKLLGGGSRAQEIGELWLEYEENSSPEAKVVKDLDKVEMILQALEYENVLELIRATEAFLALCRAREEFGGVFPVYRWKVSDRNGQSLGFGDSIKKKKRRLILT